MAWRDYQEAVAQFFRELGCEAAVDFRVDGARASHQIDVWVTFCRFGLDHTWAIECKDWRAPVPKEKVLVLKGVVDDVGADRGILLAESGFQPGARRAASRTNVVLMTLAELRDLARGDLLSGLLEKTERRMAQLQERCLALRTTEEYRDGAWVSAPRPGVDDGGYFFNLGRVSFLDMGLKQARLGHFPVVVSVTSPPRDERILASDLEDLIEKAGQVLDEIEHWVNTQERAVQGNA